jgi:hypothetical protein
MAIPFKSEHKITDSTDDIEISLSANKTQETPGIGWYKEKYNQSKLFAHEMHPFDWDHFFHRRDGQDEAMRWLIDAIEIIDQTIWKHTVVWSDLTLFVDFGERDDVAPKHLVWPRPVPKN